MAKWEAFQETHKGAGLWEWGGGGGGVGGGGGAFY